jgi:hypothetical protein
VTFVPLCEPPRTSVMLPCGKPPHARKVRHALGERT